MESQVSLSELRDTVSRMENRHRQCSDSFSIRLMTAYKKLVPRFQSDLRDEREELLSRGGALMLIQRFLHDEQADSTDMDQRKLIERARGIAQPFVPSAHVSSGGVAAALLTSAGNVSTGVCLDTTCSLGFCAEHAAVVEMLKARESEVRMIVAVRHSGDVLAPCGRCRELLWQLTPKNAATWVVLGPNVRRSLATLLPER